MSSRSLAIDQLKKDLKDSKPFTRDVIREFYMKRGENLTDNLLAVRINRLKKLGALDALAKGIYQISKKRYFDPELSPYLRKLYKKLGDHYPLTSILLWETAWLNEFVSLQILNNWMIIEVEGSAEESVFESIHRLEPNRTFLNPGEKEFELYLAKKENPIIIKTLLTGSPKVKHEDMVIPKLEKIMVDLYYDKLLDKIFQAERANILNEAFKRYNVNYTTLLSYAARRGKKKEMADVIKKNVDDVHEIISKSSNS